MESQTKKTIAFLQILQAEVDNAVATGVNIEGAESLINIMAYLHDQAIKGSMIDDKIITFSQD